MINDSPKSCSTSFISSVIPVQMIETVKTLNIIRAESMHVSLSIRFIIPFFEYPFYVREILSRDDQYLAVFHDSFKMAVTDLPDLDFTVFVIRLIRTSLCPLFFFSSESIFTKMRLNLFRILLVFMKKHHILEFSLFLMLFSGLIGFKSITF